MTNPKSKRGKNQSKLLLLNDEITSFTKSTIENTLAWSNAHKTKMKDKTRDDFHPLYWENCRHIHSWLKFSNSLPDYERKKHKKYVADQISLLLWRTTADGVNRSTESRQDECKYDFWVLPFTEQALKETRDAESKKHFP